MSYAEVPVRTVGGRLALDFLNTADWSQDGAVIHEKLGCEKDVRRWTDALNITQFVDDGRACDLAALRDLRAELRELFLSAVVGRAPNAVAIQQINDLLALTANTSWMVRVANQPWLAVESSLLDLILTSTKAILSDPREIGRVGMCAGPECGWFFLDESRNRQRKWCMMETCGNRAKARRYYAARTDQPEP
ncbi:CGNR zinc finger domain-containing protein [uncultured Roseobacter sp.]|uniref:CGNR zinc finger domain-containing protein n=1 Tax=uncultured Roseobacter sp. TaxID=114847 RepID=UPI0026062F9D|nr:CGNR zinc finger domain-containing protein [uncultured Roseobacter sp.]